MRILCFCIVLIGWMTQLGAQTSVRPQTLRWGKVSDEEQALTHCPYDSSAAAVVLADVGVWRPYNLERGQIALQRHVRIKILKPEALDLAEVALTYRGEVGEEQIRNLSAQTLNYRERWPHWKRIPLALEHLPATTLDSVWREKRFTLREVQPGSIIEYRYQWVTSDFDQLKPWRFQREIPTLYSEVRLSGLAKGDFLTASMGENLAPYLRGTQRWIRRDLPALHPYRYGPGTGTEGIALHFQFAHLPTIQQSQGSVWYYDNVANGGSADSIRWRILNENLEYPSRFVETPERYAALQSLVRSLTEGDTTRAGTIEALYYHLNRYLRWNGRYARQTWRSPSEIYRSQRGSSADLNLLLLEMLNLAGIPAQKCFIATRDHSGYFLDKPFLSQFNHVLVRVPADSLGSEQLLDLTRPLGQPGLLPFDCLRDRGYVAWGADSGWVALPTPAQQSSQQGGTLRVADGRLHLDLQGVPGGYPAQQLRQAWARADSVGQLWQALADSLPGPWQPVGGSLSGGPPQSELLLWQAQFSRPWSQPDTLTLAPLQWLAVAPPQLDQDRPYQPLFFRYPRSFQYRYEIEVPTGYRVADLPPDRQIVWADGQMALELRVQQVAQKVVVQAGWSLLQPRIPSGQANDALDFALAAHLAWEQVRVVLVR